MNKRDKQLFFAAAFIEFMNKLMDEGTMTRSEIATHLTVTLGRFIHDFIDLEVRAAMAEACATGLIRAALDDEPPPPESIH